MQSLGLAEAKNAARTYVTRSEEEKNAFMRKRSGAFAVRSALSQCKAFRSGSNGDVPFANCVLARLYFILLELDPEAASEVAGLVQRSLCIWNDVLCASILLTFHLTAHHLDAPFCLV